MARSRQDPLTKEEARKLLAVPNLNAPTGLRNRVALELMYRCGLRVGEVCGLQIRDVKWDDYRIHLRPEVTKGKKEATVPIPEATLDGLERWKAVRRKYAAGDPHLLVTLKGTPITRFYVYKMVQRCASRAGIGAVHPHLLRHTFATEALSDGDLSIIDVQEILRHSDIRTTQLYTHVSQADLQKKMRHRGGSRW